MQTEEYSAEVLSENKEIAIIDSFLGEEKPPEPISAPDDIASLLAESESEVEAEPSMPQLLGF